VNWDHHPQNTKYLKAPGLQEHPAATALGHCVRAQDQRPAAAQKQWLVKQ